MIRIYGMHTPNFMKVVYAAEELTANYQLMPVSLLKKETRTPEHKARHPFGKVPVIEHDGQFVFESNAILRYMGSLSESAVYPSKPLARAHVDQWLEYFSNQTGRWCTGVWFNKCIGPKYFNETPDEKKIKEFTDWLMTDMPVIDAQLSKNQFVAGAQFTLADVVAHTLMQGWKEAELPFAQFKNFTRWFDFVEQRPSFKKAKAACDKLAADNR